MFLCFHGTLVPLCLAVIGLTLLPVISRAQADCSQTSTGYIPINDLGTGTYLGMTGGLYENGSNYRPPAHQSAGMAFAAQVQPLDASGLPDPVNGKVVWLSIGFSNATQEAQAFIPLASALPDLNPHLVLVDGAQGGQTCAILSTVDDPSYAPYWNTVANRLSAAGVTPEQVQAIWFKDANVANNTPVQDYADTMLVQCKRIMRELHNRFPNAHLCYVASRIYAGYATVPLNPEPYAYRSGWTMKELIADQVEGDPLLQYSGSEANAPWISWGPYLWADGTTPRSDGLTWICPDDYANDGTHPSDIGRAKVAGKLLDFFTTDSTTCSWFLNDCGIAATVSEAQGRSFNIHPNPATSTATIENDFQGPVQLNLYDVLGRPLLGIPAIITGNAVIDVSNARAGLYCARLSGSSGQRTAWLVVTGR